MTVRVESNSYLTEEQHRVYTLRESLSRNGGTPSGFLEVLAAVVEDGTWQQVPSGANTTKPFASLEEFIEAKPPYGLNAKVSDVRILLQIKHPHETNTKVRHRMESMRSEVRRLLGPAPEDDPVTIDAEKFGRHVSSGGWAFGLMVARSVLPQGNSKNSSMRSQSGTESRKVTVKQFAEMASTTAKRVMSYYRAWERASQDGLVPPAIDLIPGQEVSLPTSDLWGNFYTKFEPTNERLECIAQQAAALGSSYSEAVKISYSPTALRTAILGDRRTADAAQRAIMDRADDDPDLCLVLARQMSNNPQIKKNLTDEARRIDRLEYIRRVVDHGKVKTPAGQLIDAPDAVRSSAKRQLMTIDESDSTDEMISEAYGGIRQLVEESIKSDTRLQIEEQRAYLRRVLTSSVKGISSVHDIPIAAVADEEIVRELVGLQDSINRLVSELGMGKH